MSTASPSRPPASRSGASRPQPGPARGPQRAASIDPFRVLRKHVLLIVAAMFVGGGVGVLAWFLFLRYMPLYQAFVIFEVQQGISDASDLGTGRGMREEEVSRVGRTELAIIQQRNLLEEACRRPEVQRTNWFQRAYIDAGQPMVADAVDELENDLRSGAIRGTYLFEIRWGARDRYDAPIVLNAIADAYIARRSADDESVFQKNIAAFQQQSVSAGNDIADLQKAINELILEAGITSLDDPRYSEAARALEGIIARVQANAATRNMMETQLQQIRAKLSGTLGYDDDDIRLAETSDYSLAGHIQAVNQLRVDIRTLREQYPDEHRLVRQTGDRLRAAEAERDAQREEVIRRNLNADAKMLSDQIEQISNALIELEKEMDDRSLQLRELATKQSEYQSMQSRLMFLEESRESFVQLARDVQMLRVREDARRTRIAARATEPRQIHFPRMEIIVPLGVLLITGMTIGLIFLRELTDHRVKSASDLLVIPGATILGVVPEAEEDPTRIKSADLVVRQAPHSVLAESWRQAGTQMLRGIDQAGHQSVVFIGGLPGAGTTTAVTNLACALSAAGRRVVVVEANFRRPRIGALLGLSAGGAGLGDLLQDSVTLDEALQSAEQGFAVITAGTPKSRIVERLTTTRMAAIVAELRSRFDLVLFDAPPAVIAGDAIAIAHVVDAAVLIVRANQEERGLVARVIGQVQRAGCDLLGVVLNRPRRTAGGYFKRNFAAMAAYRPKTEGQE